MATRIDVIDCRYSSEMQRTESNADQERRCREDLDRKGIPHGHFEVIADEAVSGTSENRAGYERILELIKANCLGILIVTEQSRLSRGDNVKSLIKDIVFQGGRFISVAEGIDTDQRGWELLVGISEIHHSRRIVDTAERVRGGQEGRVLDGNGSAGDYPYGYTSVWEDPVAAQNYKRRGPKPKKLVVIHEPTAQVVRDIFRWFIAGESISAIVRRLNASPSIPRIGRAAWHHEHVRRILANAKYIGEWTFGATTTVYGGHGQKKQVEARANQRVTIVQRPALRIVDQATWDAAKARLAELKAVYGMKAGGKKRGPAAHYRLMYPKRLLNGLVVCCRCKSRLIFSGSSNGVKRFICPNHVAGLCPMATRVPIERAEQAVLGVLRGVLINYPAWLAAATAEMQAAIRQKSREIPTEIDAITRQLKDVQQQIDQLLDLASGRGGGSSGITSTSLMDRLASLEQDKSRLMTKLEQAPKLTSIEESFPTDEWVREQLAELSKLLTENNPAGLGAIRTILGDVVAEEVISAGKKRGFSRLRFRLRGWTILRQLLQSRIPQSILSLTSPASPESAGGEFVIDLGEQTKMEFWAPQIAQWRAQGVHWKEIEARTGIAFTNAYTAWKRYVDSGGNAA